MKCLKNVQKTFDFCSNKSFSKKSKVYIFYDKHQSQFWQITHLENRSLRHKRNHTFQIRANSIFSQRAIVQEIPMKPKSLHIIPYPEIVSYRGNKWKSRKNALMRRECKFRPRNRQLSQRNEMKNRSGINQRQIERKSR